MLGSDRGITGTLCLPYACRLWGRAEESLGIRELSYAFAFRGRAEEASGIRELSYACGFLGRAEESLGIRELSYDLGLAEELRGSRELSDAVGHLGKGIGPTLGLVGSRDCFPRELSNLPLEQTFLVVSAVPESIFAYSDFAQNKDGICTRSIGHRRLDSSAVRNNEPSETQIFGISYLHRCLPVAPSSVTNSVTPYYSSG